MAIVISTSIRGRRELLEICPLDACKHDVGRYSHYIFEFPKDQDRDEFIEEALVVVQDTEALKDT